MTTPKTTFVGKNPFRKDLFRVEEMSIGSDAPPDGRADQISKYDRLFNQLKPGQCVKCPSEAVNNVSQAMRKWASRQAGKKFSVRAMQRYPGDQTQTPGRVWLLPVEKGGAK